MQPTIPSILYSLVERPHRICLDSTEERAKRDAVSAVGTSYRSEVQPLALEYECNPKAAGRRQIGQAPPKGQVRNKHEV
jgi:hypothetical protein